MCCLRMLSLMLAFFGLDMLPIMQNFPGSFFGMTAMLPAITPEHSELANGPAIYTLLTCTWKYWLTTSASGELIVSKYVAESITMIAGRFGHEGLCQLRTELKKLQCEIGYIANTGQWCCVMLSGCINNQ